MSPYHRSQPLTRLFDINLVKTNFIAYIIVVSVAIGNVPAGILL